MAFFAASHLFLLLKLFFVVPLEFLCFDLDSCIEQGVGLNDLTGSFQFNYSMILFFKMTCAIIVIVYKSGFPHSLVHREIGNQRGNTELKIVLLVFQTGQTVTLKPNLYRNHYYLVDKEEVQMGGLLLEDLGKTHLFVELDMGSLVVPFGAACPLILEAGLQVLGESLGER